MRTHGSKSGVKNKTPKLTEPREYLGKIGIFLLLNSNFPHTKLNFLQRLSDFQESEIIFFNSFPISSTAFQFLQQLSPFFSGLSIFFNGFPISSTVFQFSSTAFRFLQRLSNFPHTKFDFLQRLSAFREIQENLFMAASIQKITI